MYINLVKNEILEQTKSLIEEAYSIFKEVPSGEKHISVISQMLEEINSPCVLAVAGKVKAGKSFLINALLGVDLAMTGNTETTATINVFKAGKPFSTEKPILCQWTDGSKEWKPKSFLDQLQGTDPTILEITSKIERLIFYIDGNPLLEDVTLVDTPGIGADVGVDGDSHQIHTDSYFKLRKRHQSDTINLSNSADAVIYLFNTVPTETDKSFISALYDGGKGLTAINGIGVLSKVDKELDVINNLHKFRKEFENELFTILPTSAAIARCLPSKEVALLLSSKLKEGFKSEKGFLLSMGSERAFLHERLPECTLTVQQRKDLINQITGANATWETFKIIATDLYYSSDVNETLNSLRELSGIANLKSLIDNHFFQRSKILRCNKLLNALKSEVTSFTYSDAYINAEYYSRMQPELRQKCELMEEPYKTLLLHLVQENIPSEDSVYHTRKRVESLLSRIDELRAGLCMINDIYFAYQKIMQNKDEFSPAEFDELTLLFSGKEIKTDVQRRQRYWAAVMNVSAPNSIRQYVAKTAKSRYSQLLLSNENN